MVLKHMTEITGQCPDENHDIRTHLNKLDKSGFNTPGRERLRALAFTLNGWGVESCYKDDFVCLSSDVQEAMELLRLLISKADLLSTPAGVRELSTLNN